MKYPNGYISDPYLVCKLKKSLYSLEQTPREWYSKMDAFLLSQKFQRCISDPNVYIQKYDVHFIIIVLYFDDLLITGNIVASISTIKIALHNAFEMNDLGLLKQFLGLEIEQNFDGIMVTQSKYISNLLVNFNMDECKATPFPFLSRINLEEGKSTPPMDCTIYRQLIGSLLYLTHSQPDICYAMNVVSRYMQQPRDLHWKAAKRILQYIQGTNLRHSLCCRL